MPPALSLPTLRGSCSSATADCARFATRSNRYDAAARGGWCSSVETQGWGRAHSYDGSAGTEAVRSPVLRGGCDPLFTPRPLGPLLVVAEETGGPLEEVVRSGPAPDP